MKMTDVTGKLGAKYLERLEQVVVVLQDQAEKHKHSKTTTWFNMERWVHIHTCGFVRCAIGWAGTYPYFRKRGFTSRKDTDDIMYRTHGYYHASWEAVEKFFGLDASEADFLFAKRSYRRNSVQWHDVTQRIEAFIRRKRS